MTWYAETPARRSRQVVGDAAVVLWVAAWVLVGRWIFGLVRHLAAPADPLEQAGTAWRDRIDEVAARAADLPVVGDELAASLGRAAGVGGDLTAAGQRLDEAVTTLAWVVSLTVLVLPMTVALTYLLLRLRWARRAGEIARTRDSVATQELLALRALVHQAPARLHAVDPDPLGRWRVGDGRVVAALADLELRRFGLRQSRPLTGEVVA
ncbi:MAG TPA: hypothetical protein VK038_11480 [Ornithinicoccus sp.]|nr:hypothetical protein [Ornithinicoccus sp.]